MKDELTIPQLFLSSEEIGWDGLVVRAYHEPAVLEGWIDPALPDTVLVLVTRGAMHMEQRPLNGPWQGQHIHQEDLFLKPGGDTLYELRWRSLSAEPLQTLHVELKQDLMARTAQEVADLDPARLGLAALPGFRDPLLTQISLALGRELEQPSPAGNLYAQTAAQMLAVHLLQYYTLERIDVKEPAQGLTRQQMRRVTDFILAHLSEDLSLDALAQQTGFSAYHFARLFRQTTGESPHQFVLRQRIEQAQHLLKETDTPLAHVALECGFANQSHLTRLFKQHLGLTPRAYRRNR